MPDFFVCHLCSGASSWRLRRPAGPGRGRPGEGQVLEDERGDTAVGESRAFTGRTGFNAGGGGEEEDARYYLCAERVL